MGTWGETLKSNDAFLDIYQSFFSMYNNGEAPAAVTAQIQENYKEAFEDYDDAHESIFALALAQWETKSLDQEVFRKVRDIIDNGKDIEKWRLEGVDETTLKKRQAVLEKFLNSISAEKEKAKRRVRPKFNFRSIELQKEMAPDNKKFFELKESFVNEKYQHTMLIFTFTGSLNTSGVFGFFEQGKFVDAKWINSQTLEVKHNKDLFMHPKWDKWYDISDQGGGNIIYIPV